MIYHEACQIASCEQFFKVDDFGLENFFIKIEGLNIAGSIKLKTAIALIDGLEKTQNISPKKNTIIESSSGNLGIALSIVCKARGYKFICVTDPNTAPKSEQYIKLYGAQVIQVQQRDQSGGFLGTRIDLIKEMLAKDDGLIWTNQYASSFNVDAHYNSTAKEIFAKFSNLDYLFIGAGTTGTLMGCAKFFKEFSPKTKIVAIDTTGSVTFGSKPAPRYIPGIGTSRRPEICSQENIDEVIFVDEKDAVEMCNYLLKKHGLFLGGSSGSVIHAVKDYAKKIDSKVNVVALSPDFGEKYIDTIYNPNWVKEKFGISHNPLQ